jgi:simple sugar transport system substrate-binding protein
MFKSKRRLLTAAVVVSLVVTAAGCSSSGGKKAENSAANAAGAGTANTPKITIAMVTHAAQGDTFWDIIRKGANAAAAKDNVDLKYSADPDSTKQASLIQSAIDSKVDGLAVTLSDPAAIDPVVKKAIAAGIPTVVFNQGFQAWQASGALSYFGSNEEVAGEQAGKRAAAEGAKHILCVPQAQGSLALETRCNGVEKGFTASGGKYTKLYVNQLDMPSVRSTITAKLTADKSIDYVITLGAPIALTAIQSIKAAGSSAKLGTFDSNPQIIDPVKSGQVQFVIDQQPYLQGYLAVDSLWLNKVNGNVIGGGLTVPTGPYFVDKSNIDAFAKFAAGGTR